MAKSVVAPFGGALSLRNPVRAAMHVDKFVKVVDKGVVTASSTADVLTSFKFLLSDLSEATSFANIYDQYKIEKITFHVMAVTQPGVLATTTPSYAFLAIVVDLDDATALASFALALNYDNVAVLAPGQGHERTFKPRLAANSPTGTLNSTGWIDATTQACEHYGVKICIKQASTTNVPAWYCFARYHCAFRSVR